MPISPSITVDGGTGSHLGLMLTLGGRGNGPHLSDLSHFAQTSSLSLQASPVLHVVCP